MPSPRNRARGRRRILKEPRNDFDEVMQRERAFAAIRLLFCESLPLWRVCGRGLCRRNKSCAGEPLVCLKRSWKKFPEAVQDRACFEVERGGPRRLPPLTLLEKRLRGYPPSNFVL